MFELLAVVIFIWLLVKVAGFAFRLTWGVAKITAFLLIGLALPVMIVCFAFVGGVVLLVPLVMIAVAAGILKACL